MDKWTEKWNKATPSYKLAMKERIGYYANLRLLMNSTIPASLFGTIENVKTAIPLARIRQHFNARSFPRSYK
ncbi:hypothetical protein LCGC14_0316890 [marine sediment metagenome]|uniref:Uncharacterized protein n=1 Tax=marine sediment metagenome TaxID=412755 RepID=A0A0F9U3A1_9ZZZZ